jgi:hypothetical protein
MADMSEHETREWGLIDGMALHLDEDLLTGTQTRQATGYLNHGRWIARTAKGAWLVAFISDLQLGDRAFLCLSVGPADAEGGSAFSQPIVLAGASGPYRQAMFQAPQAMGNAALWIDARQVLHVVYDHAQGVFLLTARVDDALPDLSQPTCWQGPVPLLPAGSRISDLVPAPRGEARLLFTRDNALWITPLHDAAAVKVADDALHAVGHVDARDTLHVAFERDRRLYYVKHASDGRWTDPELVAHFCSSWPSIAVSTDGRVVIAYQGEGKVDLRRVTDYPGLRKDGGGTVSYAMHDGQRWINRDLLRSREIVLFRRPTSSLTGPQQFRPFMEEFWRPTLSVDRHGALWMFFINSTRRHVYWSRFEGEGFGTHHEARGAYDQLSRVLLVQKDATGGDAIGMATFAAQNWYFDALPVPALGSDVGRLVVMLDGMEIERAVGVERCIGQWRKHPQPLFGAFVSGDGPGDMPAWCQVTPQPGGYLMRYMSIGGEEFNTLLPGRAWSEDGLTWRKQPLELDRQMTLDGKPFPNGFWRPIFMEDRDERDPARRFKGLHHAYRHDRGIELRWYRVVVSPDGRHWCTVPDLPPVACGDIGVGEHLLRDNEDPNPQRRYKVLLLAGSHAGRAVVVFTSPDLLHWQSPRRLRQDPDLPQSPLSPYPTGPIALDPDGGESPWEEEVHDALAWREHGLLMFHYDAFYFAGNQHTHKALAVCRDGKHYWRVLRGQVNLPHGDCGAWDSGRVRGSLPIRVGDELWMYYIGMPASCFSDPDTDDPTRLVVRHQSQDQSMQQRMRRPWRVGRATLRVDGWAYMQRQREATRGELVTIPLDYRGGAMEVNGTHLGEGLQVEWLDLSGQVVPGFDAASSRFSAPDAVTAQVWWGDDRGTAPPPGRYRLRFVLHSVEARLYAFGFQAGSGR